MRMQYHRAFSKFRRDKAEKNQEITAEVKGTYPNFKRNLASKQNFVNSKVQQKPAGDCKSRFSAARSQKMTTRLINREIGMWKQKIVQKSQVSSIIFVRKPDQKIYPNPRSHEH